MADWIAGLGSMDCVPGCETLEQTSDAAREKSLVAALQAGVDAAYEALLEQFEDPVYNLIYRLVNNPADAGDVTQEVFLKIFRNIRSFRSGSSLKTWIYRIAVHEAYNHRRWFRRHKHREVELESEGSGVSYHDVLPDRGWSPYEQVLAHERFELIEEALQEVKPLYRIAVVLRDIEELSYDEIADILSISIGTVKSRILRGREALRRALADRLERPASESTPAGATI
jgi:RNA polymerase sigma-70 factor, ECF subfamily